MKSKTGFKIYSCIWGIAIVVLIFTIFQNVGDAKVVNYSGIVRGASQKVVKEELQGISDDEEIARLDAIIENLRTGEGEFGLSKFDDKEYQEQLMVMTDSWSDMKIEIMNVRAGGSNTKLFEMSEEFFEKANVMVNTAEQYANQKLIHLIAALLIYLVFSTAFFSMWFRKKQKEIHTIKYHDEVTGISNIPAFSENIKELINRIGEKAYVLLYFDIDDFKFLNNTYGYQFGTSLLKIIAAALADFIDTDALCARESADKFLVFAKYDEKIIERLKSFLYKRIHDKAQLNVANDITFSIGACDNKNGEIKDPQILLDNANLAHKNAKQAGRGKTVWFNELFMKQMVHDNMLMKHMHKAIEREEFLMYLQPKFDILTGEVFAAEVLARWDMPEYGILPPNDFIPLFENNGFIHELDFYMLKKTCAFLKEHHLEHSKFTISVNFSRVTIYHKNFYKDVLSIMKAYDVSPSCIEIEITESAFNGLEDSIIHTLTKLQKFGMFISIDDFGTGYSTLNLLNTLPIDILKIDRGFVNEVGNAKNTDNIIELIIGVAHTLDIQVVCEGIETKKQLEYLKKMKCDYGQGYLISKPIIASEFYDKYLRSNLSFA